MTSEFWQRNFAAIPNSTLAFFIFVSWISIVVEYSHAACASKFSRKAYQYLSSRRVMLPGSSMEIQLLGIRTVAAKPQHGNAAFGHWEGGFQDQAWECSNLASGRCQQAAARIKHGNTAIGHQEGGCQDQAKESIFQHQDGGCQDQAWKCYSDAASVRFGAISNSHVMQSRSDNV